MNKIAKNKSERTTLRKEVSSYIRSCNKMVYIIVPFICILAATSLTFRRLVLAGNVLTYSARMSSDSMSTSLFRMQKLNKTRGKATEY